MMRGMSASRRQFLGCLASLGAAAAVARLTARFSGARAVGQVHVDASRLRSEIEALSVFGRPPGGSFADGVSRTAYSDADIDGRRYVMDLMRGAGLTPRIDAAGNIFALRAGAPAAARPILIGSHIDSVPGGGNFDGALGSLAAIEAARAIAAAAVVTRHPVEVVVWAHEEGGTFPNGLNGSRAVVGQLVAGEMDQAWNGLRRGDGVRRIGGDPGRIGNARRAPWFHAYLELHIEQGGTLDRQRVPIGVVEGIVAISRFRATIVGAANHAGTTPMGDRQDALVAAAELVLAVREEVTRLPGRQVGTVGRLDVTPNAANVIPGRAEVTIELRDLSAGTLTAIAEAIRRRAADIAGHTKTAIAIEPVGGYAGARAAASVMSAIERAADALAFAHARLPSGAGHDAQMMAELGPMGMIFVPSIGGISHSPRELTSWEDCARGADVLLGSVLEVDALDRPQ
jgi:beta-ureidopropionase / N-carbamoyl-L-amino-acid hydrolase